MYAEVTTAAIFVARRRTFALFSKLSDKDDTFSKHASRRDFSFGGRVANHANETSRPVDGTVAKEDEVT